MYRESGTHNRIKSTVESDINRPRKIRENGTIIELEEGNNNQM